MHPLFFGRAQFLAATNKCLAQSNKSRLSALSARCPVCSKVDMTCSPAVP
jgi:hypothetical protein